MKKYSNEDKIIKTLLLKENILKKFSEFIKLYNNDFNMEIITKFHLDKITSSFFNKNVCNEIDKCNDNIDLSLLIFNKIIDKLGKYIEDNEKSKFKNKYSMLKLEYTERDGYYITCTSKRSQVLKKELSKLKNNILKIKSTLLKQ